MTKQMMDQNPMMKMIMSNPAMMKMVFSNNFINNKINKLSKWHKKCKRMAPSVHKLYNNKISMEAQ
jgi:hypothetical protein